MSNVKDGHFITKTAATRFKVWLAKRNLSLSKFALNCNCSRQYLDSVLKGKKKITNSVREHFKSGGYELL